MMGGIVDNIKTGVDILVEIVKEKGSTELKQLSKWTGYSEERLFKWSKELEKAGIIEIDFGVMKTRLIAK